MSRRKFIDDYLMRMASVYKNAAAVIAGKYGEYQEVKNEIAWTQNSRLLTVEGKRKKIDELSAKKNQLMHDIETARADAAGVANKIKTDADNLFRGYYMPNKDDIDPQTVALLEADIMKYDELMEMAAKANPTTKRLIAKALERMGHKTEANAMMWTAAPAHLRAMKEMMSVGDFYCGGARMSGYGICKSAAKDFDKMAAPLIESAPHLVADTDYRTLKTTITEEKRQENC